MHISEFIDGVRIHHDDRKLSMNEAMLCLVNKMDGGCSGVSFQMENVIELFNTECLHKDGEKYFYDIKVARNVDMIDTIRHNFTGDAETSMQVVISDKKTEQVEELTLITFMAMYNQIDIRIIFEKLPKKEDVITIKYRGYLFDRETRNKMLGQPLETDTHKYFDGMVLNL